MEPDTIKNGAKPKSHMSRKTKKKIMKKIIILCVFAFLYSITTNAQNKLFSLSIGGGVSSLSMGGGSGSVTGYGVDLVGKSDFTDLIQGFVQTGYHSFSDNGVTLGYMPFLLGVNFKVGSFRPGIGMGYSNFSGDGGSSGGFSFSPQIGLNLNKFDILAHYTSTSISGVNFNIVGLKFLYKLF